MSTPVDRSLPVRRASQLYQRVIRLLDSVLCKASKALYYHALKVESRYSSTTLAERQAAVDKWTAALKEKGL